jgi:hypothetical protein
MRETGPSAWAFEEFGAVQVEDHRWRRRLVRVGERAARRPRGRVTEVFTRSDERQGAYGLLESDVVSTEQIGRTIFEACARRCAEQPYVLCPVDGTSLTLTDRGRAKDFGPIGARSAGARGLKVMNAMVLSADGVPLGVSSQQWWTRPQRRRRRHRDTLRPDQKETRHWLAAMKQTREVMEANAPGTRCWFQLDREGDSWSILREADLGDHWFTIRASHQRRVVLPSGKRSNLKAVLAKQVVRTEYPLEVRAAPGRKARIANMVVRACRVTLDIRDKRTNRRSTMEVNVVQAVERGTTPRGEKPIKWALFTNRPVLTIKDLTDVIKGYSMRWRIEELHRTWKSGACRVEESQLRSTSAVSKWATILMAVAVRIERIKQLSREQPDRPATDEFTPVEIKAAALLYFGKSAKKKLASATTPSIADVTLWIASLGGYTGKTSSGGPPGSITLSRGLESIRAVAQALEALSSD